jgi:hypothetical protein
MDNQQGQSGEDISMTKSEIAMPIIAPQQPVPIEACPPSAPVHETMTVGQAQAIYTKFHSDLDEFYNSVYKDLISKQRGTELSNSNYLHALQLTSLMLSHTSASLVIFGGSTTNGFISVLEEQFRKTLTKLREVSGKARIIIINAEKDHETLDKLLVEFPATLSVAYGISDHEEQLGHYIVADDMVRIEEPHKRLTKDSSANDIKARVVFNNRPQASRYTSLFDSIWAILVPSKK